MRKTFNHEILKRWGKIGKSIAQRQQRNFDWLAVKRMISATKPLLDANRENAKRLLEQSNFYLTPLKDPFDMDFGLHRWLQEDREEAYSDWLAWIIEQLKSPERIVQLVCGENSSELAKLCVEPLRVEREIPFITGENVRRTDIEISFGATKAILIEVKTTESDKVDPKQLQDLARYRKEFLRHLLLALPSDTDMFLEDFTLVLWRDLALRLRKLVPTICRDNVSVAAMVLSFLGAVEQNLLHLPPTNEWHLMTSSTLDYLAASLGGENADA
jgi:hypothetical protein